VINEDNILAATALAYTLGIRKERIQEAIHDFKGLKRRLEVIYKNNTVEVIDDFGSSPAKAQSAIAAVRVDFPEHKIIAVFEPTSGNRQIHSLPAYKEVFRQASQVIIPPFFSQYKKEQEIDNVELAEYLQKDRIQTISPGQ
jgi:UDP-N-acetylmuramate-alanine ligase